MAKKEQSGRAAADTRLLAAALDVLTDGVAVAKLVPGSGKGLRILWSNRALSVLTGYSADQLVGRKLDSLVDSRRESARLLRWFEDESAGPKDFVAEGGLVGASGVTLQATWSASRFVCPIAGPVVAVTYRDVTEKRRFHQALVHAQRLDAVGHLAGGVAHDFNNILSVINGYCEILAGRLASDRKALRQIGEIHSAGRRGAELTQQLLAFGRRQPTNAQIVNFNDIVLDNVEILGRLIGKDGRLDVDLAPELGNVRADPAQCMQALLNLVLNARDSLAKKGGRIVVATADRTITRAKLRRATDMPPGRYVSLSVSDNGSGMSSEAKRHIFEPFYTTKKKGNGLGLALVYGVVQQFGGYVSASSELSVGTTLDIMLPRVDLPIDESARTRVVTPLPVTRGRESVLLIEEDDVVRKMVAGILTADGYRVTDSRTAKDAARRAAAGAKGYELLIASLTAPEMEKLAQRLYRAHPGIRFINLSGQAWTPSWLPPGQVARLPKPFALSELLRAARRIQDR